MEVGRERAYAGESIAGRERLLSRNGCCGTTLPEHIRDRRTRAVLLWGWGLRPIRCSYCRRGPAMNRKTFQSLASNTTQTKPGPEAERRGGHGDFIQRFRGTVVGQGGSGISKGVTSTPEPGVR